MENASCDLMRGVPSVHMMGKNWKAVSTGNSNNGKRRIHTFMTMSICEKVSMRPSRFTVISTYRDIKRVPFYRPAHAALDATVSVTKSFGAGVALHELIHLHFATRQAFLPLAIVGEVSSAPAHVVFRLVLEQRHCAPDD